MRHPFGSQPFLPIEYWNVLGIQRMITMCQQFQEAERLKRKWGFN